MFTQIIMDIVGCYLYIFKSLIQGFHLMVVLIQNVYTIILLEWNGMFVIIKTTIHHVNSIRSLKENRKIKCDFRNKEIVFYKEIRKSNLLKKIGN